MAAKKPLKAPVKVPMKTSVKAKISTPAKGTSKSSPKAAPKSKSTPAKQVAVKKSAKTTPPKTTPVKESKSNLSPPKKELPKKESPKVESVKAAAPKELQNEAPKKLVKSPKGKEKAENKPSVEQGLTTGQKGNLEKVIKKLIAKGKESGAITYDDLNNALPAEEFSSDQIEDAMSNLSDAGVQLVDSVDDLGDR